MIIVKVDEKVIKIPSEYKDISVSRFNELWKVLCKYDTDSLKNVEGDVDVTKVVEMEHQCTLEICSNLLGMSIEDTRRVPFERAVEVVEIFNNMMNRKAIDEETSESWSLWGFTFEGEIYYFPKINFESMTFGEFAELQQIRDIYGKEVVNRFEFIPMQMARSCRKHKEGKDDYDLEERSKLFQGIDMETVMKWAFFLTRQASLLSRSTQTSKVVIETLSQKNSQESSQDMVG